MAVAHYGWGSFDTSFVSREEHERLEVACGETRIRTEQGLALVGLAWSLRLLIEREEAGDHALQEAWERED